MRAPRALGQCSSCPQTPRRRVLARTSCLWRHFRLNRSTPSPGSRNTSCCACSRLLSACWSPLNCSPGFRTTPHGPGGPITTSSPPPRGRGTKGWSRIRTTGSITSRGRFTSSGQSERSLAGAKRHRSIYSMRSCRPARPPPLGLEPSRVRCGASRNRRLRAVCFVLP